MDRQSQVRVKFPNRIRQAIIENGYTVEEISEVTGIPKRSLYDYCAGRTKISRERLEVIAGMIGCPSNLLLPTVYIQNNAIQCDYDQVDIAGDNDLDKLRRAILQLLAGAGASAAFPEFSNTWERLAYALNHPYRLDDTALTRLEYLTDTYWELYQGTIAKVDFLGGLQGHLGTITKLLSVSQPTTTLTRLCKIASRTAQMVGENYLHLSDTDRSRQYHQFAIELAQKGNSPTLEAIALGRKAFLAIYTKKPQAALPDLRQAYTLAEEQATGQSLAWIAIMEAEALSSMQSPETFATIDKVENLLSEDKQGGEDRNWTSFNFARFAAYKGACYVRLHQSEQAQNVLSLALQELPAGPTGRKALILADLAKSFTQQGEIEEACQKASQSLACAVRTKSIRALQEVRTVKKQLEPWKKLPDVKLLGEQLRLVKFV